MSGQTTSTSGKKMSSTNIPLRRTSYQPMGFLESIRAPTSQPTSTSGGPKNPPALGSSYQQMSFLERIRAPTSQPTPISSGGQMSSKNPPSLGSSYQPMGFLERIRAPAPKLVSASPSESQDGNIKLGRSPGQRLLDSTSLSHSTLSSNMGQMSSSTKATRRSSVAVATVQPITSSNTSIDIKSTVTGRLFRATSNLLPNPLTVRPEASTRRVRSSTLRPSFGSLPSSSSLTLRLKQESTQHQLQVPSLSGPIREGSLRRSRRLSTQSQISIHSNDSSRDVRFEKPPPPYLSSLQPSPLRPNCLPAERIAKWLPAVPFSPKIVSLNSEFLNQRVSEFLLASLKPSTLPSLGIGLLHFHAFCDREGVREVDRSPCSTDLLAFFVVDLAGIYSAKDISGFVSGVSAWHLVHRLKWDIDDKLINTLLKGCKKLAPLSPKLPLEQGIGGQGRITGTDHGVVEVRSKSRDLWW